jgi:hypothetical protein
VEIKQPAMDHLLEEAFATVHQDSHLRFLEALAIEQLEIAPSLVGV